MSLATQNTGWMSGDPFFDSIYHPIETTDALEARVDDQSINKPVRGRVTRYMEKPNDKNTLSLLERMMLEHRRSGHNNVLDKFLNERERYGVPENMTRAEIEDAYKDLDLCLTVVKEHRRKRDILNKKV